MSGYLKIKGEETDERVFEQDWNAPDHRDGSWKSYFRDRHRGVSHFASWK